MPNIIDISDHWQQTSDATEKPDKPVKKDNREKPMEEQSMSIETETMNQLRSFFELLPGRTINCLKRYFDVDSSQDIDLDEIVHINPKKMLRSGKGCGYAALDEIAYALKEIGLIQEIDEWLVKQVCPHCGRELEVQNRDGKFVIRAKL